MELSFSKFRLPFCFFVGALICQLIASNIPAFDTSHLVSKPSSNSLDSTSPDFSRDSSATGYSVEFNNYPPNLVPSAGLRWDALHYIDVALSGAYTYEHQYAFSPGVPIVLRLIYLAKEQLYRLASRMLLPGFKSTQFCSILTNLINALLVAMVASQPSLALYNLTERVTRSKEFSFLTLLVHVILGAPPVIIRSVYAEPFFAWFTFEGLSACHQQKYLTASLYFALATGFRTNGILLPCFLVYSLIVQPVFSEILLDLRKPPGTRPTNLFKSLYEVLGKLNLSFTRLIYCTFLVMVSLSPFVSQQYMAYISFCQSSSPRPWCNSRIPLIYSFVQSHYWDVGPWRYWTIAQIPNFLLALPILSLAFASVIWFFLAVRQVIQPKHKRVDPLSDLALTPSMALTLLPYAIHALVLSLTLFIAAHVQISLRVLPAATPWISWAGAALIIQGTRHETVVAKKNGQPGANPRNGSWWPFLSHLWLGWSVIWIFISSVLWLAFLPPA